MEGGSCGDCGERTAGHKACAVEMNGKQRQRVHERVLKAFGMGERRRKARQELCQAAPAAGGKVR